MEKFAIYLADDLSGPDAWNLAGGDEKGADINYAYRKRIENDGVFRRRLAELKAEKEFYMSKEPDDPYAPLIWQARQSYRLAVANGDQKEMRSCTELALKLVDAQSGRRGGAPQPSSPPPAAGRPVREAPKGPVVENPFRAKLRAMKMVPPGTPASENAA